jgi:hypothetical protein
MNSQGHGGCDRHSGQGDGHSGGHWNDSCGGHNIGAVKTDHNDGGQGNEMAGEGNIAGGDHGAQHGHGMYCH